MWCQSHVCISHCQLSCSFIHSFIQSRSVLQETFVLFTSSTFSSFSIHSSKSSFSAPSVVAVWMKDKLTDEDGFRIEGDEGREETFDLYFNREEERREEKRRVCSS